MKSTDRTWIYFIDGKFLLRHTRRPTGKGPWPYPDEEYSNLVMACEGRLGNYKIDRGPKFDKNLIPECLKLHLGFIPDQFDPSIWHSVPPQIKDFVAERVRKAQRRVADQWWRVSNEETLTGVLFGGVETLHSEDGWDVQLRYIEFSKQSKEPTTGADLAIVLDVEDAEGKRAFKSIWFQAKSTENIPTDVLRLPRLEDQVIAMNAYTNEAYILVYSPKGVKAIHPRNPYVATGLDELLEKAMSCKAGDPSAELLGNSINRKHVLSVMIDKSGSVKNSKRRR
nr:hypothetical protein [uncultured Pseudomonas sp.]